MCLGSKDPKPFWRKRGSFGTGGECRENHVLTTGSCVWSHSLSKGTGWCVVVSLHIVGSSVLYMVEVIAVNQCLRVIKM